MTHNESCFSADSKRTSETLKKIVCTPHSSACNAKRSNCGCCPCSPSLCDAVSLDLFTPILIDLGRCHRHLWAFFSAAEAARRAVLQLHRHAASIALSPGRFAARAAVKAPYDRRSPSDSLKAQLNTDRSRAASRSTMQLARASTSRLQVSPNRAEPIQTCSGSSKKIQSRVNSRSNLQTRRAFTDQPAQVDLEDPKVCHSARLLLRDTACTARLSQRSASGASTNASYARTDAAT